jgi:hypothetical protein
MFVMSEKPMDRPSPKKYKIVYHSQYPLVQ